MAPSDSTVDSAFMHGFGTTSCLACKQSVHLTVVSFRTIEVIYNMQLQ